MCGAKFYHKVKLEFQCYFILSWYGFKDAFTGKGHRLLNDLKFNFIEIGFSYDLNPFRVCWMGKFDGNKSKVNSFWLFITLETNVILTIRMYCGLKVLLWEAGRPARRQVGRSVGRPGAGGIGTKTNSAPNCSWVGVGVWAELGNKQVRVHVRWFGNIFYIESRPNKELVGANNSFRAHKSRHYLVQYL